jgi:hypothetical protein
VEGIHRDKEATGNPNRQPSQDGFFNTLHRV